MRIIILVLFFLSGSITSIAQSIKTDSISKSEISKLVFMVGNWEGKGWMMGKEGKSEFEQTEIIQFKLDSTAILVEGQGKSGGMIIHDAMAILSYNKEDKNYAFRSYLKNGQNASFKSELIDNKLYWYPNENVRYIIWLNESGQWYEKGEFKRNGNWSQFFEMTLSKVP